MDKEERLLKICRNTAAVSFIVFMTLFCLGKILPALIIFGAGVTVCLVTFVMYVRVPDENTRFILALSEIAKLEEGRCGCGDEALHIAEREYDCCAHRTDCREYADRWAVILAGMYAQLGNMSRAEEYISLADINRIKAGVCKNDGLDIISYFGTAFEIALKNGGRERAAELYKKLTECGDICRLSKNVLYFNIKKNYISKLKSEYLLISGDFEGALKAAEEIESEDETMRLAAVSCKANALIYLKRFSEARELLKQVRETEMSEALGDDFDKLWKLCAKKESEINEE